MAVYEAGNNIVFIDQDYQWYMYDGSGVWPKYSGGKVEKTEDETEKNTEAEITEPEVPKTEAWTESTEGYTEAGETEDASGIMYGGAKFAYLDSVLERIDNEEMILVPLGTQNKTYLFYYTIKDARYIRDPGLGEAAQDCLVITVEMATEIDAPGYTMGIEKYDFIAFIDPRRLSRLRIDEEAAGRTAGTGAAEEGLRRIPQSDLCPERDGVSESQYNSAFAGQRSNGFRQPGCGEKDSACHPGYAAGGGAEARLPAAVQLGSGGDRRCFFVSGYSERAGSNSGPFAAGLDCRLTGRK